jgi:hypothetical protein
MALRRPVDEMPLNWHALGTDLSESCGYGVCKGAVLPPQGGLEVGGLEVGGFKVGGPAVGIERGWRW